MHTEVLFLVHMEILFFEAYRDAKGLPPDPPHFRGTIHIHVYVHVHIHVHVYSQNALFSNRFENIYVCMYIHVYAYINVYIHVHSHSSAL